MKEKDYNAMSTPDLEETLNELKAQHVLAVDDEEREEELEAEIKSVQEILDEREAIEQKIEAEMEAEEE